MPPHDAANAWWRWGLVLAYFAATSLGHLRFTQWLLRPRSNAWWGSYAFKDAVPALLVAAGVALLLWVVQGVRRRPRPWSTALWYWGAWMLCVAMVDRFLTYSIYEYAHYPQYALLAWFIGRAQDPGHSRLGGGRVLFWATLLGMVDEVMQYLWITPGYGHYLDFNDFLVNLLAAAAGVMLYYGRPAQRPRGQAPRLAMAECLVALCITAAVVLGFAGGYLAVSPEPATAVPPGGVLRTSDGSLRLYLQRASDWYGAWQPGQRHGEYLVLSPRDGAWLMAAVVLLFLRFPQRIASRDGQAAAGRSTEGLHTSTTIR